MQNPIQSTKVSEKVYTIVDFLEKRGFGLPEINRTSPSLEDVAIVFYYLDEYYKSSGAGSNTDTSFGFTNGE